MDVAMELVTEWTARTLSQTGRFQLMPFDRL